MWKFSFGLRCSQAQLRHKRGHIIALVAALLQYFFSLGCLNPVCCCRSGLGAGWQQEGLLLHGPCAKTCTHLLCTTSRTHVIAIALRECPQTRSCESPTQIWHRSVVCRAPLAMCRPLAAVLCVVHQTRPCSKSWMTLRHCLTQKVCIS